MENLSSNRYVNLMTNSGFKAVFGDENNKDVVIGVLNMLLPEHHKVTDISYLRTELQGQIITNREFRYDFVCRDTKGLTFIVEMQCYDEAYWFKRCVSYCCRSYDRLTVKGSKKNDAEDDNKLVPKGYDVPPLFFIGFMGAEVRHEDKQAWEGRFISEYTFMEKTTHELQDETIIIIFAELNRFNKSEKECVTAQDKLMYLFKNISKLENDKTWDRDRFWQRFFKACEIAAFNEEKRTQYEQDMYDERRLYGQLTASYNNGLAEGREKGLAEGRQKGLVEGIEKGLAEGREAERLENAKKLVASGVDIDLVCSTLGVDKSMLQEK